MSTYHRLLLLTTLGSALLTFCLLQAGGVNFSANKQNPSQQLQSQPQPLVTEYYAMTQPGIMTLAWHPCAANTCEPGHGKMPAHQPTEIGI